MSETELNVGKLWKIDISPLTIEEWCKEQCNKKGIEKRPYYNSYKETFLLENEENYVIVDNELYQYDNTCYTDCYSIDHLDKNEDGSYSYITEFYNGGTCLSERLEEMIRIENGILTKAEIDKESQTLKTS